MTIIGELIDQGKFVPAIRPWRRTVLIERQWDHAVELLATGRLVLLALWGEPKRVHMALTDEETQEIALFTLDCSHRQYSSVGRRHPPAIRLERSLRDLYGHEPLGLPDARPWLDHDRWGIRYPLGEAVENASGTVLYDFLAAEGEGLHQIPVGPVHAGIIEPGHFRFSANGETIVRLEERLGYVHKGIEGLMAGASIARAAELAGRVSGDSTVAYALAFARAVEAALEVDVPPRAHALRGVMAELERIANHLGDIGAICNDASFALLNAHCGILRERVLRTAQACFGHRLMRDRVVPGGVAADIADTHVFAIRSLVEEIALRFPVLVNIYDNTPSLLERTVATGILKPPLAKQFAAGGFVGRASGRARDARRAPGYPPYDGLAFEVPVLEAGDVNARVWIRIREVEQSLSLLRQLLDHLSEGPTRADLPRRSGEGAALVEGFRGDIFVWLRLASDGMVAQCHLRDPSVFQWPLLEAAIEGNIVADFPLCNKSFNCSYSGHDL